MPSWPITANIAWGPHFASNFPSFGLPSQRLLVERGHVAERAVVAEGLARLERHVVLHRLAVGVRHVVRAPVLVSGGET